ncbi:cell division protein FtsQ/DivIB [Jannaschia sp. LMIT008]|uniref:cell division protein FtsQ/DivIB n=1 Tax=Jannaschia maritima TaxID=3032585 RepID=UPI002810A609|nr:cell division protein FtsQ/DivIB [Jannaschia sp. LMIT008]
MTRRADPAPSVLSYRLNRLWLRRGIRLAVLRGLPLAAALAAGLVWASDPDRRAAMTQSAQTVAEAIRGRPEFAVTQLRVEGADGSLRTAIAQVADLRFPVSRFDLDLPALVARLEALDPVHSAEAMLRTGGVLLVRVAERRAVVAHLEAGTVTARDATGHRVATLDDVAKAGALPLIAGPGAQDAVGQALALTRAAAPLEDDLVGLVRVGKRRWDLVLSDDRRILLPEAAPVQALDRALAMHAAKDVLSRDVAVLDMRLRGRPVLRLSARALDELHRLRAGGPETQIAETTR